MNPTFNEYKLTTPIEQWAGNYAMPIDKQFTIAAPVTKTKVVYVLVGKDDSCLELKTTPNISTNETLGVFKFLTCVTTAKTAGVKIDWSELIRDLEIENQFVPGLASVGRYITGEETLYIFLIDPK